MRTRTGSEEVLRCSFCHKSQDAVAKLISSPTDYPRAYICDECIAVCNSSQLLLFDRELRRIQAVCSDPAFGDIHTLTARDGVLYVTATASDSVIGLDGNLDNRSREVDGLKNYRVLVGADRVAGDEILETDGGADIACEDLGDLFTLVGVHLQ